MAFKKGHPSYLKRIQNEIIFQDDELTIFITKSKKHGEHKVLIDTEDWNKVKQYHWSISTCNKGKHLRIETKVNNKTIRLHNIILNAKSIDHKNLDTLDNRKYNLRVCTQSQNSKNQPLRCNNKSGYKGVFKINDNKWAASIKSDYKKISLGRFLNPIEAAKAYNEAAIKYHGEFARLNEI